MLALRRPVASRASGGDDLRSADLEDAGQPVDVLLDLLAVTAVLHEVGHALGGAGDLDNDAGLGGDKADDDVLTVGGEAGGGVESDESGVHVRARQDCLRNHRDGRHGRLEHLLVRQRVLECLLAFFPTNQCLLMNAVDVSPTAPG